MTHLPFAMGPCAAERIIVCIDACIERTQRVSNQQKQLSTFAAVKKCAEAFLCNKSSMNSEHQFSMLVFKASVIFMTNFHNNIVEHVKQVQSITPNQTPEQPTQLSKILQNIYDKVFKDVDDEGGEHFLPLRVVMFYGRSGICVMDENPLSEYKNVIIDVLYLHKPVLNPTDKERIRKNLSELQSCQQGKSFCAVAVAGSLLALKYTMKLLTHPNLRVPDNLLKLEVLSQYQDNEPQD